MSALPKSPFPPALAFILDNPLRRLLINRDRYLRDMGVVEGCRILEVGCGPGFFTEALSIVTGKDGVVYAQDVEKRMLERLERKLKSFRFQNVIPLLCNSSALDLPSASCDIVFCANVFEEIYKEGEMEGTVREITRVLKASGILVIKEHRPGGTRRKIEAVEDMFINLGYNKVFERKTILSYNSKLRRPPERG
ncbi:MAG: class I SAM-dependent methyltransferase [Deltaproteobacteria bacterium]|nr:class I SAM-dependent methyltransferase [Deltaproteobacteria bacterium]